MMQLLLLMTIISCINGFVYSWTITGLFGINDETEYSGSSSSSSSSKGAIDGDGFFEHIPEKLHHDLTTAAQSYLDAANADDCQRVLVKNIKQRCGELNEEQMSKVGVRLYNCVAKSEGRQTYTCDDSQTLTECTSTMSPVEWNSYLIVSQRTKFICYILQQQHFAEATDRVINTLANSAHQQLAEMRILNEQQVLLGDGQRDMVKDIREGHESIREGQEKQLHLADSLLEGQGELHTNQKKHIAVSKEGIARLEEGLVSLKRIHEEINNMAMNVHSTLHSTAVQVNGQYELSKERFSQMEAELDLIYRRLKDHREDLQDTLKKIDSINSTIVIRAGVLERIAVALTICANLYCSVYFKYSFRFYELMYMCVTMVIVIRVFFIFRSWQRRKREVAIEEALLTATSKSTAPQPCESCGHSPDRKNADVYCIANQEPIPTYRNRYDEYGPADGSAHTRSFTSPIHHRSASMSSSTSSSTKCIAFTKDGRRCKNRSADDAYCRQHISQSIRENPSGGE